VFRRRRPVDDFAAEIESHLQLEIDRLQAEGLTADEARAAARRTFGNTTLATEHFFESNRPRWRDQLAQDVRYAVRTLRKAPAFAAAAILTMAVGIGATTAIFSVVDATLLRPLPYPDPGQLVSVVDDLVGVGSRDVGLSQPEWLDLERSGIFEHISPAWYDENNLTGASRPTTVRLTIVAPNYFALLGVKPQLGRSFPPQDRTPGFTGEAVISDGMWQRGFGRDPSVLEKSIRLDTDLYRIIGVMPPDFRPPGLTPDERQVDVWAATSFYGPPLVMHPPRNVRNIPGAIARLAPGLSLKAAQSRVDALVADLRKQYPADYPEPTAWAIRLVPLRDRVMGNARQPLLLLLAAVALVLVIGSVNVANLLLARASARGRELAVREALGAGRARLIRQLLTESLVLSFAGAASAIVVLFAAQGLLMRLIPAGLPRLHAITVDWTVLLFALSAALVSGAIFGLVPALQAGRVDVILALKHEGRGMTSSSGHATTRRLLVVAECALSLVLLVSAGLLVRSFWSLLHERLGFDPERVVTVRTRLPYPNDTTVDKYPTIVQEAPFVREVVRRAGMLPGVDSVAVGSSDAIPLDPAQRILGLFPLLIEGRGTEPTQAPLVDGAVVTPGYFPLLGRTLVRGRLLTDFDNESAQGAAVINEAAAKKFWPGEDPVGRHVKLSRSATAWTTIVGVVEDARTESLQDAHVPVVYASAYQRPQKHLAIFLRGHIDAAAAVDRVREQIQAIDPALPVFGAQALSEIVSTALSDRRFAIEVVGLFAVTALLLAAIGIYGVIAYLVSERTREIGIRLALGADRHTILRTVLGQGLGLVAAGLALGLVCAVIVSRFMAGLLYGVQPADPPTFIAVAAALTLVGFFACYIPARRAIRIDPNLALRN
jgi:putative ABC transport system permease protein